MDTGGPWQVGLKGIRNQLEFRQDVAMKPDKFHHEEDGFPVFFNDSGEWKEEK